MLYTVVSLGWIYLSGLILSPGNFDANLEWLLELGKGTGFVLATASVLYVLLRRRSEAMVRAREQLRSASEELSDTAALLGGIFEAAPLPMFTTDREGRITSWNPAAERVLGWAASEVIGKVSPLGGPETQPEYDEIRARALGGEAVETLIRRRRRDGQGIALRLWSAPVFDGRGKITGLLAIMDDVTLTQAIEEERARLATAVEQAGEAILITDPRGTIVYVNPAFERASGYSRVELIGANPRVLKSGRQSGAFYESMWGALQRGETWSGTFVNKRKDGSLYEEDAVITPLRDPSGEVRLFVGVKRDVTHERALERQLAAAQRMEAVGQLAGGIAHDFNNLLTAISGYAQLLRDELPGDDPRRADADEILRASGSAAGLVRQLLAFGRRQILHPEVLDLGELVGRLNPMLRRLLGESVRLIVRAEPDIDPVFADPGQLEQVLVNLTVNARDAMRDGGTLWFELANVSVDASLAETHEPMRPGSYVQLTVSDTGIGMDSATLARIFEPFFTTKPVGSGMGLGLATAYGIVKQSGGFMFATSEPGHGASFQIYLPRTESADGTGALSARATLAPARGGSETVLLVEDEPGVRAFAKTALERLGYRVLVAGDGSEAEAVASASATSIDLLVTDVTLPGIAGPEIARRMLDAKPELRVLFISGYTEDESVRRGVRASGVAFLPKPFTAEVLGRRVREVLDGARMPEEQAASPRPPSQPAF